MKKLIAIGTAIAFSISATLPARGNPALLAPAAGLCSTGVGCVLVGTVVIGGVLYYVYTHQGKKVYSHQMLDDPEEEMERMGNNAFQGKTVRATSVSKAFSKCAKLADGRKTDTPQHLGGDSYRCRYS